MSTIKTLQAVKTRMEEIQTAFDRASGALDQALEQLQKDFGCEGLEEAEKKLEKLTTKKEQMEGEFEEAVEEFESKWGE